MYFGQVECHIHRNACMRNVRKHAHAGAEKWGIKDVLSNMPLCIYNRSTYYSENNNAEKALVVIDKGEKIKIKNLKIKH